MRRTIVRMAALCGLLATTVAYAQQPGLPLPQPRLNSIFPMGGQNGTAVEVAITGVDLENVTELLFSDSKIKAELIVPSMPVETKPNKDKQPAKIKGSGPVTTAKFKITIPASVRPGHYDVRLISPLGVSNPRSFVVGDRPEVIESDKPHNDVPLAQKLEINSTVHGIIASQTDVDYYSFTAKRGQRVLVSCLASSIDSRARPYVEICDARDRKLTFNRNYKENDALADLTVPEDGDYTVRVTEFAYLPTNTEHFYRLTLTDGPWIDAVFPSVVNPNKPTPVTLYGRNLPGGKTESLTVDGKAIESVSVPVTPRTDPSARFGLDHKGYVSPVRGLQDGFDYTITNSKGISSNAITIGVTELPIVLEKEAGNDKPETAEPIPASCEVSGRIDRRYDKDWFSLSVKKGDVYYIDLLAERIGSEMDAYFVVRNASTGTNIVDEQDDDPEALHPISFFSRSSDPAQTKFTALDDGTYVVGVGIRDSNVNFGPRCGYRLRINKAAPDFRAIVMPKSRDQAIAPLAYQGGEFALDIFVHRQDGFNGPVVATAENLPPGITAQPALVGDACKWGTIVLTAADDAPPFTGPISVKCTAQIGEQKLTRTARPATITWSVQPGQNTPTVTRLDQSLILAVRPTKAPLRIRTDAAKAKVRSKEKDGKETELPATWPLYVKPGDKITLPVDVAWQSAEPRPNPVTLTLEAMMPSQQTAPIGIQGPVTIAKEKNDATMTIDVKSTAVPGRYSLVVRGDTQISLVRDPNKKDQKTNATVSGFLQPLQVIVLPLTLGKVTVTAPPSAIKPGNTGTIVVRVDRQFDYTGAFNVRVTLPKEQNGVTIPDAVIPAGADEVKLTVSVSAEAKPGNISSLPVVVSATVHGKFPIVSESKVTIPVGSKK